MNDQHQQLCSSDEWRAGVRDFLPRILGPIDLGGDVLEIGPGYGATTDVLCEHVPKLTAVEIDADLATALQDRFAGTNVTVVTGSAASIPFDDGHFTGAVSLTMLHHVPSAELQDVVFGELARVVRPGGVLFAADSLDSPELREFHAGDTYVPVNPDDVAGRLGRAGFASVEVETTEFGWKAVARRT